MKHEILYQPSFSVARVLLDPGESVRAESGAMVSMSTSVTLNSGMSGGLGKAIGRLFGGESLFQTTFTATHGPGEVILAPSAMGDILHLELQGGGLMVTSGGFLAGSTSLNVETRASLKGFFAGEGLFLMRILGVGSLLINTFGAIHPVQLQPGQTYVVDTGHIVAFDESVSYELTRATRSLLGSFTSGEGIVAKFSGPGIVYMQTRSPQGFGSYLSRFLPSSS
ncbi:MAG: TIGR00266 family protein [Fimbriimonas sp.]